MATRNTLVLEQIVQVLQLPHEALARLEEHYKDALLIVAGTTQNVAEFADTLRLRITIPEQSTVLDYIAHGRLAGVNIDHVEDAINALFHDRFIEPEV